MRKTFELVAVEGTAQKDFDALFAALDTDPSNALGGVRDTPNQPIQDEPERVKDDLRALSKDHLQA